MIVLKPMIRKFKNTDSAECAQLIYRSLDTYVDLSLEAKEYIKRNNTPEGLIKKSKLIYMVVVEKNKKILGTGALDKNEIRGMFTDINHQGKGIGTKIIKHLEDCAKKRYKKVFLHAALNAIQFYKKQGYVEVQLLEERKGNVIIKNMLMEKEL